MSERSPKFCRILIWVVFWVGLILVSPFFGARIPNAWMFNAPGDLRTDGIFGTLSPFLLEIDGTWGSTLCFFAGIPLFSLGFAGLVAIHARTSKFESVRSHPRTTVALVIAGLAHLAIFAAMLPLFFVPAGQGIRPMALAVLTFMVSLMAAVVVIPVSVTAMVKEKARWLGLLGIMGGIAPFFFSQLLMQIAMKVAGFYLED